MGYAAAAYAFVLMWTAPFIFGIAAVHTAPAYIISRFFIGWALAAFVTCQFWTSIMFSPNVVGFANALAGGWGNAGIHLANPWHDTACLHRKILSIGE